MMHHHHSEENRTRDAASQSQQPNSPPPTRQTKSFTNVIKTDLDEKCTDAPLELFKKIYDSFFPLYLYSAFLHLLSTATKSWLTCLLLLL